MEYKLKQNIKEKKNERKNKRTLETDERGRTKQRKQTQINPFLQENKFEDKRGRTNML